VAQVDARELRELENKCIQEEAPTCVARCPIHVDVRAFLKKAAAGLWEEARQALAVTMPLPGIVGRICDHPCQQACRRAEAGGAIAIADLERATVERAGRARPPTSLPARNHRVAVIGSGLSGLTAALDLARKGYRIAILEHEDRLGGVLRTFSELLLPAEVIDEEMGTLEKMGVEIRLSQPMDREGWFGRQEGEFDAVYVGIDGWVDEKAPRPLRLTAVDPGTLATSTAGVFVGGKGPQKGEYSPIEAVAGGRRAATSIDRYLQKVSLTAGREREGPYETRLFTSLAGVESRPVVPAADKKSGYTDAEARQEAERCLQCECMECVKVCLFLERFKAYPKRYVRQISNDATMVMGSHGETNRLVNSCSLCDLCETVCPNDLSMARVCMEGRESLVSRGKMPPSAHEFALEEMLASGSDTAAFASHEPGKKTSRFVFFPGCQLSALYPEHVQTTYALLRTRQKGGTGLMLRCCGVPAKWAARDDLFNEALRNVERDWDKLGRPTMIVACPTCYRVFKEHLPEAKVKTLWRVLSDDQKRGAIEAKGVSLRLAVHDPCASRHEPDMHRAVRELLIGLGCAIEELSLSRDRTECCGFGGLMSTANPPLARDVAARRALRSAADYVTYCATCRTALAGSGKRVVHVLDLLFPGSDPDPAARKVPGLSERRENRYRLKEGLLKSLWGKEDGQMEEYEKIRLLISDDVLARMEERRILREDVQKTIDHAEKTGVKLLSVETGRARASYRPAHVTYWVEYSPEGNGFRIHNAYSHRMEVVEDSGAGSGVSGG
jgi:NADPH-dependent glutamate synthase beta subunit-like oxidoreductase